MKIPPHILWPGAIILLIGSNIAISVVTLSFANADGGVEVVDDTYLKHQADAVPDSVKIDLPMDDAPQP